ncbi:MAG: sigma-70 family RNA polymerase sigma factor [Planctomycetes bacterium]|nr:sigma-70 family RNA polymerase sigma factor [Planctomycetota bacterium]
MSAPETSHGFPHLLARARSGDAEAMTELVRMYEPEVRIVARVLLGPALRPHLDSLDLVQSVHRSLIVGLRQDRFDISTPENLVALALTMVRRKVARKWRHDRRQQRLSRHGDAPGEDLARTLATLSSGETDPASAAALNDAISQLCESLSGPERRLMELRLSGCSTAEAARELGADVDVLRAQLSRLRQRLRAAGVLNEWL